MVSSQTHYELKLEGNDDIIALLKSYIPEQFELRREANAKRRAVWELFGDEVECSIVSVRRVPARTVRRKLRI